MRVRVHEGYEVLESVVVEMDPVVDGFAGGLVELVFDGERHVLAETALGSGNRLLRSRWRDPRAATRSSRRSWRRRSRSGVEGSVTGPRTGAEPGGGGR